MKKNNKFFRLFTRLWRAFHEASYLTKAIIKNFHKDYNFTIIVHEKNLKLDLEIFKIEHKYFYLNSIERYLLFSVQSSYKKSKKIFLLIINGKVL